MFCGGFFFGVHFRDTHHASSANKTTPKSDEDDADAAAQAQRTAAARPDYPRPAPPGAPTANENMNADDAPPLPPPHHIHQHQHNEDEAPPKKDKNEKKLQELPHWKLETTRPTRDNIHGGSKGHAMGMRIAQPAGKALGV